jgi:hypothetical protein
MPADQTRIDLPSLDDFNKHLQARLLEAQQALTTLTNAPAADRPPLGEFHDAEVTADRYEAMKAVYVERLRRLIDALTTAQAATTTIAGTYHSTETLNASDTGTIGALLGPGT